VSLRTQLLLAFAAVVFIPLALLAFGLRQGMTKELKEEYKKRVDSAVASIQDNLGRESAGIAERLASLKAAIQNDNGFRSAAVAGELADSTYLADYAGTAMGLTGLSMLQIQDADGRIVSSGHFRNEHGRLEPGLAVALARARDGIAFAAARAPNGDFVALARSESFRIADRMFTLVGGVIVDGAFLRRLASDCLAVSLRYPGGRLTADSSGTGCDEAATTDGADVIVEEKRYTLVRSASDGKVNVLDASLSVAHSGTALTTLLRGTNALFLAAALLTGATALLLAVWLSSRISQPLAELADKTAVLDLDRLDLEFAAGDGEVGTLSRMLGDLATRLRTSTTRVREAERRATVGDLARQVNHDIKNGLIPLRNVMRHLSQVERDDPDALAAVFAERRQTIESSIGYLETLATNYERLSTRSPRRVCDLNALIADVAHAARGHEHVELRTELGEQPPRVLADPVALRRILENLVANAVDSLEEKRGRITVSAQIRTADTEQPVIRVTVSDTGRGMSAEESGRIFTDFYTTKPGGTGLGLSIVKRLVIDLQGTLRVESEPGVGTRMIIDLPSAGRGA
jgi:signal transduction histidine kinase